MFVFRRSKLLLPLLLFLPDNTQGMDGCQVEMSAYAAKFYWRCGDICTSATVAIRQNCTCGDSQFGSDDGRWCCGTNCTGGCLRWKYDVDEGIPDSCAEWSPTICTTGLALNLNESCEGQCNYHGQDVYRNYLNDRSYVAASSDTNICVKEGEGKTGYPPTYKQTVCNGDSIYEGELDWCRKDERRAEECPLEFVRCRHSNGEGGKGTNFIPGQCIERSKIGDGGVNNCLDRSDEDPFQEAANAAKKETNIDVEALEECNSPGGIGLECIHPSMKEYPQSSNCIWSTGWCNEKGQKCPVLGADIRTNNPTLCAKIDFWQKVTCGKDFHGFDRLRCKGANSGQCVHKENWGVEGPDSCRDGSDLYRPIKQPTEEEKPLALAAADKRDSAEAYEGQHSQQEMWKTEPKVEELYNEEYLKESVEETDYEKDSTTGLWMLAVSKETCTASQGFVCKVRLHHFESNKS